MEQMQGFPFFPVEFDRHGQPVNRAQAAELVAWLAADGAGAQAVAFVSHGWNNNMEEARSLYDRLLGNVRRQGAPAGLAVVGLFWPSKKFTDESLIPGGAASVEEAGAESVLEQTLDAWLADETDPRWRQAMEDCRREVPKLESDPAVQDRWVERLAGLLDRQGDDDFEAVADLRAKPGREVLEAFAPPVVFDLPPEEESGAAGVRAMGLGSFLGGITGGAAKFLNLFTYYAMKDRAGLVGMDGLNPLMRQVASVRAGLRLHLAGHSFGGRLVSAALRQGGVKASSLTLLQAAFSHYGFSDRVPEIGGKAGFFRPALNQVAGPVLVTHTANDLAVGVAYAVASRGATQGAAGVGDAGDPYGGIGRNGALRTPEAVSGRLLQAGQAYTFEKGKVHNLEASAFVRDHGDVTGAEVAWAWVNAMR